MGEFVSVRSGDIRDPGAFKEERPTVEHVFHSARSGRFFDADTWEEGRAPAGRDEVIVIGPGHVVTIPQNLDPPIEGCYFDGSQGGRIKYE